MKPFERYNALVKMGKLEPSVEQEAILSYLMILQEQVIVHHQKRRGVLNKLTRHLKSRPIRGLYLWGGVGVGKTMLMDFFYESLPVTKLRLHFHAFMQHLHRELSDKKGQADPLAIIGRQLARHYAVICFDEFLVTNVADAMILAQLFKALFKAGVCLVTTSNQAPEQLYEHGVQRERFLPTIELLKQHLHIVHLSTIHDYRRRIQEHIIAYYTPLGATAEQSLQHTLLHFAEGAALTSAPLVLENRQIPVKQRNDKVIWFEFEVLCGRPRSQVDYLLLSQRYSLIIVSNIPCLEEVSPDLIVSFINLIDILYDAKTKLILSAATPINKLYTHGAFRSAFLRTESRLLEMQTW